MPRPDALPGNADGAFYVTPECISCGLCADIAPQHFKLDDADAFGRNIVYSQPSTPAETAACHDAATSCPVEAIAEQ
jgi:ferredoxin